MLRHPCILGGPQTKEDKIRIGCRTPAFQGAQKRAEMLHHPCILGGAQKKRTKSELGASPLPYRGPKRGRKCYVTPAFSGVPKQRGTKSELAASAPYLLPNRGRKRYVTLAFSGVPKQKETKSELLASNPYLLGGPKEGGNATSPVHPRGSPNKKGQNPHWLPHPYLLGGPKEGGNATSPVHSWGCPALPGARKRAEMLRHPCILGVPQTKRDKIRVGCLNPLPSRGPKRGWKCYVTPGFSRVPKQRGTTTQLAASPPSGKAGVRQPMWILSPFVW